MQTFWFLVLQFLGCLPFTKSSEKSGWKVNRTRLFGSAFQRKISGSNGTSEKLVLFSRSECSKRKFLFHSFKAIYDTSFSFSRPFFGKCNWLVQMVISIPGRNFSVLNFAHDFIPKPWIDRFAHVNGKPPRLPPYIFSNSYSLYTTTLITTPTPPLLKIIWNIIHVRGNFLVDEIIKEKCSSYGKVWEQNRFFFRGNSSSLHNISVTTIKAENEIITITWSFQTL